MGIHKASNAVAGRVCRHWCKSIGFQLRGSARALSLPQRGRTVQEAEECISSHGAESLAQKGELAFMKECISQHLDLLCHWLIYDQSLKYLWP